MDTGRNKKSDGGKENSPGHVTVDARGRNVWKWNDDQLDSTTIMLQKLENSSLSLEPTLTFRKPDIERAGARERTGDRDQTKGGEQASRSDGRRAAERNRSGDSGSLRVEQSFKVKLGGGFDPYNRS
jgi:hypothetical protein